MRYLYLALSVTILLFSCAKETKESTSKQSILKQGPWKLTGGTLTVNKPNGKDTALQYIKFIPDCYKDDYITFDSLIYGKRYTSSVKCNAGDPEYVQFIWQLKNNESTIDLLSGFNNLYTVNETIEPYHFDTISKDPFLVLDTVLGVNDTLPGQTKIFLVLDTIRDLKFTGIPVGQNLAGAPIGGFDIYEAAITNFSSSSFTLNFSMKQTYPDSTGFHAGIPNNELPIQRPDTVHYSLIYSK
ncbi:MAG: hypothetical protein V4649_18915 [Bacteroidota bacterium]